MPPGAYVERIRVEAARRQLEQTDDTVTAIAARCGFGTAETLRRTFIRRLGVSPTTTARRSPDPEGPAMQIAIVLYPSFTALDAIGPYEVLRMVPGAEVRFVAHETGPVTADSGVLMIGATHTLDETGSPDVVLVPGGPGSMAAARDAALLDWLRRVQPGARWTTSVCTGSVVLAAAGLLTGKRATSHWSALAALTAWGSARSATNASCTTAPWPPPPGCPPASTWGCGWPDGSPRRAGPKRSSW